MPISIPVVGSPSSPMSGTARPPVGLFLTTCDWYLGCGKIWLNPPPDPYWNGATTPHAPLEFRRYCAVPHPVSNARLPLRSMASAVPPTDVTHGSPVGQSG